MTKPTPYNLPPTISRGYTLVELIVAVGLFALVMLLASGAYLMMIGVNRQAQGIATGIDNLSFALETMTRTIRSGSGYSCGGGDCPGGAEAFSFVGPDGAGVTYTLENGAITQQNGVSVPVSLTDPSVVVSSLTFYVFGTAPGDGYQPHVTIVAQGSVPYAAGKEEKFTVETGATMRGSDL